jgi:homoserine O-acetyltransferase
MKRLCLVLLLALSCFAESYPTPKEGDYSAKDFAFKSGEKLGELRLHYVTIGTPHRDARGQIDNAVLILHGTGGSGKQFLQPQFADELFGPGQPLDAMRSTSSCPTTLVTVARRSRATGCTCAFQNTITSTWWRHSTCVAAQHLLLAESLGIEHLRLISGTSMGCMHSFVWGETFPDFMDALMPMAC